MNKLQGKIINIEEKEDPKSTVYLLENELYGILEAQIIYDVWDKDNKIWIKSQKQKEKQEKRLLETFSDDLKIGNTVDFYLNEETGNASLFKLNRYLTPYDVENPTIKYTVTEVKLYNLGLIFSGEIGEDYICPNGFKFGVWNTETEEFEYRYQKLIKTRNQINKSIDEYNLESGLDFNLIEGDTPEKIVEECQQFVGCSITLIQNVIGSNKYWKIFTWTK